MSLNLNANRCLVFALCLLASAGQAQDVIDFEKQIRPLFIKHCGDCHGPKVQKSGLRLDARHTALAGGDGGPVIVAGKSGESELLRRMLSDDPDERMPPEGDRLPKATLDLIKRWIDAGAKWPETDYDRQAARDPRLKHWAFLPVQPVTPPTAPAELGKLDRFIVAKLREQNLQFAPPASRRTLLRRLSLDLLGLPPTPEQINRFAADKDPQAYAKLVDELLKSPRYGERWAQHWLDVVRYADTHGFEVNTPRENAWPYRDYVIRAFNEDKPYDQFVREQLVGDALKADAATGFLVAAAVLLPGQIGADAESKRLARQDALDEIIVGTSATMLGLTLGCARCHDHKFDPLTARDYYAMQAFFAGVDYGDRPMNDVELAKRKKQAATLVPKINELQQRLSAFQPRAFISRTLIIDEEDAARVQSLQKKNGPGNNPAGTKRGYKDDVGSADRVGNLSRGRYTWWNNVPGQDVLTYAPGEAGRFRLWLSWGAHGSGVHTRDARYVLDQDGNLMTKDDQREIAKIDQYYQAGILDGETAKIPLWSGMLDVGIVELAAESKLILRGGETGTGITADVIVLQEANVGHASRLPDNISQTESVRHLPRLRAAVSSLETHERFAPTPAKFVRFTTFATSENNRYEPCIDELEIFSAEPSPRNIALGKAGAKPTSSGNYGDGQGKHRLAHVNDGRYGNSFSWISNQKGGGWVQIEFAREETIDHIVWARDRDGKFRDRLPVRYKIEASRDGKQWQTLATHQDRIPVGTPHDPIQEALRYGPNVAKEDVVKLADDLKKLREEKKRLETPLMVYGGKFRKPDMTYVLRRGDPEMRLTSIGPATPALFKAPQVSDKTPDQERRMALANWIASPKNPLTARVMVNRIWLYHFGRGLVDTPSDFGVNGARPSHPELLDWLAGEFVRSGWSVKHIHRLIVLSKTYQQSSRIHLDGVKKDRGNRLLWRFPSRRLEGEAIRDCMLTVSGELNLKMGGPGFNFFKSRGGLNGFPPVEKFGPNELRRMIYAHKIRMERVPVFGAFDCPDAGQATPRRSQSTTAIQALNLFNSQFVIDRANRFAECVKKAVSDEADQQATYAFEVALGRKPTDVEKKAASKTIDEHDLATLCRVLFNSNEFLFMP